MVYMKILASIQQSGPMNSHMTSGSGNQDTILIITLILGLIILVLIGLVIGIIYLFYTGRMSFSRKKSETDQQVSTNGTSTSDGMISSEMLPDVSLTPFEKKIIEVVIAGHNVLQSDLPKLVDSSKSKVSEALSNLEDKKLIQRFKAGRSLTIKYIFEPVN